MDIIKILVLLLFAFDLPIESYGSFLEKHWRETKTVCGYNVSELSVSIHVDLLKISRTEKPYKGFDKIFINYEHFKCCLQESGVTALKLEKDRLNCMQGLIECFKDVQKRRCSFDYRKYLRNDFTLGCLIVGFVLTCYAIIETIIFFYTSRQRRIRQQRRYNDFRWDEIFQ